MMRHAGAAPLLSLLATVVIAGCGGDDVGDLPLSERLTAQATRPASRPPVLTAPAPQASPALTTVQPAPTAEPTLDAATLGEVNSLGRLVLGEGDVPAGFTVQRSQRAFKRDIVTAQIAIPELAKFLQDSTLTGAWGALYTKQADSGQVALNSIVYLFATPEDARAFVDANTGIRAEDYLSAVEVQQVQADVIGDAAYMARYRLVEGRSLEYAWAQGKLAGQIVLRYTQDTEDPDDPGTIVGLARAQSVKMAEFLR